MDTDSKLVTDSGATHGSTRRGIRLGGERFPTTNLSASCVTDKDTKSEATASHLFPNLNPWSWGASTAVAVPLPRGTDALSPLFCDGLGPTHP